MMVLDAGCGKRSVIGEEHLKTKSTVGAEISYEDIRLNSTMNFKIVASLEYLPLKNEVFNLIICRNVVEHLRNPHLVFKEFDRVLKKRGKIFIRTPNIYNPIMLLSAVLPLSLRNRIKKNIFGDIEGDTYRTYYNCNTQRLIIRAFGDLGLYVHFITYNGLMAYFASSRLLLTFIVLYEKITDTPSLRWLKMWIIASFRKV